MSQFTLKIEETTKWVEYDTHMEEPIQIEIRHLDEEAHIKILNKAKIVKWVNHQKESDYDPAKLRKLLIKEVLVNIKAKIKHLKWLVVPKVKLEFDGDPEKELVYDQAVEDLLSSYAHGDFCEFLTNKAKDLGDFIENEKEEEKENLKPGSGTKRAPGSSTKSN